ncbi:Na+/H+ antiporter subunit E [Oceanobacillus manasiensis]|uniref:Na+/H+ antiporter subunit E n=1 Tax=Oceanobacillus manasiensis TaxID=586413 RepID=UPI0005A764CB|nr:Na+/H+ antiporter subunit E [Oceanobacillus manasiensis]
MAFQIVINLIIAFLWMFLSESYSAPSFIAGYLLGLLLLFVLRRFVPDTFYLKRFLKIGALVLLFIKELLSSNWEIVKLVYKRKQDFEPGIFALPIDVKSNWEITLLANLISLTPGTLSVAISHDNTKIYIHAMHIQDSEKSISEIKNTFEKAILEVSR